MLAIGVLFLARGDAGANDVAYMVAMVGLFEVTLGVLLLVRGWPAPAPATPPSAAATR